MILDILANALVLLGAAIFVAAGLGLRRFPDAYSRASAVATAGGLGLVCITLGAVLHQPSTANIIKVLIAIILQLTTSAVGAMVLARAAVLSSHAFAPGTETGPLRPPGVAPARRTDDDSTETTPTPCTGGDSGAE